VTSARTLLLAAAIMRARMPALIALSMLGGCVRHTYTRPVVVNTDAGDVAWVVEDDGTVVRCVESSGTGPVCVRADVRDR